MSVSRVWSPFCPCTTCVLMGELLEALKKSSLWIKEMADSGDGGNFDAEDIPAYMQAMSVIRKAEQ